MVTQPEVLFESCRVHSHTYIYHDYNTFFILCYSESSEKNLPTQNKQVNP